MKIYLSQMQTGILNGDRAMLAKAITLVESRNLLDIQESNELLQFLLPYTGNSIRMAVTGPPGAGKSTFIDIFGQLITSFSKKVAVLTIDPSSNITHGSILGDKTRMEGLSKNFLAFVRPSPSGGGFGGVSERTREAILLCEAAGFEIIIIETVGVGQSEISVSEMVDCFILLLIAGAGDELQGLKKGVMEMADIILINKADGNNLANVQRAQAEINHALNLTDFSGQDWRTRTLVCSALENKGIDTCWDTVGKFIEHSKATGYFERNRDRQKKEWLNQMLLRHFFSQFKNSPSMVDRKTEAEKKLSSNEWTVFKALEYLTENYPT